MKQAKDFRQCARNALRGRWVICAIVSYIAGLFGANEVYNLTYSLGIIYNAIPSKEKLESMLPYLFIILPFALLIGLLIFAVSFTVTSIVVVGQAKYYLQVADMQHSSFALLFIFFYKWKTALHAHFWRTLYTALWSLLFIVPGVIVHYNYFLVPYILAEDHFISAKDALERSKTMMQGHRLRLFYLQLSFIGWTLLSILTFGLGFIVLIPYQNAAYADFYRDVAGHRSYGTFDYIVDET